MKMDTVWQAKVADSAIKIVTVTLDVAGVLSNWAIYEIGLVNSAVAHEKVS